MHHRIARSNGGKRVPYSASEVRMWVLLQRLYRQVRLALRALYIKQPQQNGTGGDGWWHYERQGEQEAPAHAADLPGPHGGKRLHILAKSPKDASGEGPAQGQFRVLQHLRVVSNVCSASIEA